MWCLVTLNTISRTEIFCNLSLFLLFMTFLVTSAYYPFFKMSFGKNKCLLELIHDFIHSNNTILTFVVASWHYIVRAISWQRS